MGKAYAASEKAQPAVVGRVPLVDGGRPLLYPRYNSVEELLQLGKNANTKGDGGTKAAAGERPSKKQKRDDAAAGAVANGSAEGDQAAAAPPSKYAVIGEDGLTYKQRRQQRRAEERAAKAQAEAHAAAAAGGEPAAAPAAANGSAADRVAKKNKRGAGEDLEDLGGGGAAAAAAAAKGNADEAARMRAVLGFTAKAGGGKGSVAGADGGGAFSLAALARAVQVGTVGDCGPAGASAAGVEAGGAGEAREDGRREQKEKRAKKKEEKPQGQKKAEKSVKLLRRKGEDAERGASEEAEGARPEKEAAAAGAPTTIPTASGRQQVKKNSRAESASERQPSFQFQFQVQAAVEAEAEARLVRLMALDSAKDGFVPRRVWISGMPHEYDEETFREYWSYCGELEDLYMMTFPDSGNFNGTAFITFKTQDGYEAALACNGELLEGRALRVERCKAAAELKGKARAAVAAVPANAALPGAGATATAAAANGGGAKAAAAAGQSGAAAAPGDRVPGYPVAYVGNIAFEVGVEELQRMFATAGVTPATIRLHTDKASGRSKGYAHVHFSNDEDVDKAMALDGAAFHGRKIRVSYAQPKPAGA